MKKYELKTGTDVTQALEAMETKLDSITKLERNVHDFLCIKELDFQSDYLKYIKKFYTLNEDIFSDYDINFIDYDIHISSLSRPLTFFDIVFFVVESIAQSKRRLKRRLERLKKTISRRFVDYRVIIRSFANKVIRRNTEEESVLCGSDRINLRLHIKYFQLWTKKIFQT